MATIKPRITVTLEKRQHDVLHSISESTGQSMSAMVSEVIELSMPVFERMAVTFQQLKNQSDKQKAEMAAAMDRAQDQLEPIAQAALDQFDLFLTKVEKTAIPKPQKPPITNRGGNSNLSTGLKRSRTKG